MATATSNHQGDNVMLLPPHDSPYLLQDVYELIRDECRSEIVLQWSEGYLVFRAEENTDSLEFDFHPELFEPSPDHEPLNSCEKLTGRERSILKALVKGPRTKQQLGARAKVVGALTRGGGGMLGRRLITGNRQGRDIQYTITATGRKALAAAIMPWKKLLGKECGWTWVATNQQGYCDSVMLSFDGIVPTVLIHVIASSIEVFSIAQG